MSTLGHSPNVPTRPIRLHTPTKIALTVSRCPGYPAPSHGVSVRNLVRKYDPAESAPSPPPCLLRGGARTYDCPVHGFHDHNADNGDGSGMVPAERALRAHFRVGSPRPCGFTGAPHPRLVDVHGRHVRSVYYYPTRPITRCQPFTHIRGHVPPPLLVVTSGVQSTMVSDVPPASVFIKADRPPPLWLR